MIGTLCNDLVATNDDGGGRSRGHRGRGRLLLRKANKATDIL